MLFGFCALVTGAAVFAILWPLAAKPRGKTAPDVAFYKAKLAEIGRETEAGLLAPQEAAAARTEAARRLLLATEGVPASGPKAAAPGEAAPGEAATDPELQAAAAPTRAAQRRLRIVAVLALLGVPALSVGLYAMLGHPSWPDAPLAARLDVAPEKMDLAAAVAKVEAHLLRHPDDGRGYEVLVPAYLSLGRIPDAVRAAALAMQKLGATPQRETVYGETLVYAGNGVVTAAARRLFAAAAAQPQNAGVPAKALFFLGLAAFQDGDKAQALTYWRRLLAQMPAGAGRADLEARIAALEKWTPPAGAAAIAALAPSARQAVIHAMVDKLAARLSQNGHDIDGWLRLIRAYKVMQETDKARAALARARRNFGTDAAAIARLDALARELGLES